MENQGFRKLGLLRSKGEKENLHPNPVLKGNLSSSRTLPEVNTGYQNKRAFSTEMTSFHRNPGDRELQEGGGRQEKKKPSTSNKSMEKEL